MSEYANFTRFWHNSESTITSKASTSSETITSNPFSDKAATSTSCESLQTVSSKCTSDSTVINTSRRSLEAVIVRGRSVSISKFTLPFTYVDSLDLYRSKQPKSATITRKIRKLCRRILPKSAETPARVGHRNTKGDIDQLELSEDHEEIRAEVEKLVRKFNLRFGLEVRERTESYEETRKVLRAEMAEERRRRETRKVARFERR